MGKADGPEEVEMVLRQCNRQSVFDDEKEKGKGLERNLELGPEVDPDMEVQDVDMHQEQSFQP